MNNWKYISGAEVGNSTWEEPRRMPFTQTALKYAYEQAKKKGLSGRKLEDEMLRIAKTTPHQSASSESEMRKDVSEWVLRHGKPEDFVNNSKTENAIYSELNKADKRVVIEEDGSWYVYDKNGKIVEQGRESNSDNAFGKFKAKGYNKKACNQDSVARMFKGLVKDEEKETEKNSGAIEELETKNSSSDDKFAYVMREFDEGKLKTPDGKVVTDPEQAKAIAYSESKKTENGIERAFKAMKV